MKICSYNIEWFDKLFEDDNSQKNDSTSLKRLNAIKDVLEGISADVVCIIEAPNNKVDGNKRTVECLENFANHYGLQTTKAKIGYPSRGMQEIAVLFNPQKVEMSHVPSGNGVKNPPFNGRFEVDTDDDSIHEIYEFYRPPLELEIKRIEDGMVFNLMAVHTKSKGIFNSSDMLHWERESRGNRKKLYAECEWIRRRVDEWLDSNKKVIVVGDINDGPGMDNYEFQFGKSAVEIIMGSIYEPERILKSYIGKPKWKRDKYAGWVPSSTRFKDRFTETYISVLIDHILVSQNIPVVDNSHIIWNPYQDDSCEPIKAALLEASDHFPVSITLR